MEKLFESQTIRRMQMKVDLAGKTALVTGAAHGIGRACALKLVGAGANIIALDIDDEGLFDLQNDIIATVNSPFGHELLVGDTFGEVEIDRVLNKCSRIDILVSNPYKTTRKPSEKWSMAEIMEILQATLASHLFIGSQVAAKMRDNNTQGKIIFISSVYGTLNRPNSLGYDTAKAGLNQGMRVLAREFARHGINVNAVAPGYTHTPGEEKLVSDPQEIVDFGKKIPLGHVCSPEDIANMVTFLASDLAQMITGQVMTVDGGYSLADIGYNGEQRI